MEPNESRKGGLFLSILGRLSVAVLLTLAALIVDAFVGAYFGFRAMTDTAACPAEHGFEKAGADALTSS